MRLALLVALLVAPVALAQPSGAIDATITISPDASPQIDAPADLIRLENETPGERYQFNLTLTRDYTTFEIRAKNFGLERPRQLVPSFIVPETEFPLFREFPNEEIWDVDAPARVFHANGTGDDVILRLGIDGPRNVSIVLARDVTPPNFTLGEVRQITHFGFYQETTTDELVLADLQVRKPGETEWIQNPTPEYHFIQRFPIQGLDPASEVDARVLFTDWAGNTATSDVYTITTAPKPETPLPIVSELAPAPNSTVTSGLVVVRARIQSPDSPVTSDGVRLFFDKREVSQQVQFEGDMLVYVPTTTLTSGKHSVAVEVANAAGGEAVARWSFEVPGASKETPMPPMLAIAAVLVALVARRVWP